MTTLRKRPKQERAKDSFHRIVIAAGEQLEEGGLASLTTQKVASRADVNISTLYKYFPDKMALLRYLADDLMTRQMIAIGDYFASVDPSEDMDTVLNGVNDAMLAASDTPGVAQLQRSYLAVPELHASYRQANMEMADMLKPFLESWGLVLTDEDRYRVVNCIGECGTALMDLAVFGGKGYDPRIIEEMKRMQRGYIRQLLADLHAGQTTA